MSDQQQWIRQVSLRVSSSPQLLPLDGTISGEQEPASNPPALQKARDLSEVHFKFQVQQSDVETPNNCSIRLYNLAPATVKEIQDEYDVVVLRAGYRNGRVGVIFTGTIKQFRTGKENATDTYLDILAADGDVGMNWGFMNQSLAAGTDANARVRAIANAMGMNILHVPDLTGKEQIRGKVLFGMAKAEMAVVAESVDATWSVQNGQLQVVPRNGYLPGAPIDINAGTGMVGIPELTEQGVRVRTLLNSSLRIGGLIRLNNRAVNQLLQQNQNQPVPFNQWTGIQHIAKISADGYYRLYVVEHAGDTRGQEFYSDCIALAVDFSSQTVLAP